MLAERIPNDVELGYQCARLIQDLYGPTPGTTAANNLNARLQGQFTASTYTPPTSDSPRVFTATSPAWGLIAIGGTENVLMGSKFVSAYYGLNPLNFSPLPINFFLEDLGARICTTDTGRAAVTSPNLLIVGHSLGGAVGIAIGAVRNALGVPGRVVVVNFGTPKPGTVTIRNMLGGVQVARWMCDDDPVPLVLPTFTQAPAVMSLYNPGQLTTVGQIVQTQGGLQIDGNYQVTSETLPQTAIINPTTSLATWLYSLDSGAQNPHQIDEYVRRLAGVLNIQQAAEANAPIVNTPPVHVAQEQPLALELQSGLVDPGSPMGVPETLTRAQVNRELKDYRAVAPGGRGIGIIVEELPSSLIFQKVKANGVWVVTFGGVPFAVAPRRKRAGALARAGNDFIRRLLIEESVDSTAMCLRWIDFCNAAVDPTSGIVPLLNSSPVNVLA